MSNITEKIQNFMKSLETREEFCEVAQYLIDCKYEETLKSFIDYKLSNKLVETTNEQPNNEQLEAAINTLEGDNSYPHRSVINYLDRLVV